VAAQAEEIKAYNLEVINTADWFVNLGPKGNAGGKGVVIGSTDPYAVPMPSHRFHSRFHTSLQPIFPREIDSRDLKHMEESRVRPDRCSKRTTPFLLAVEKGNACSHDSRRPLARKPRGQWVDHSCHRRLGLASSREMTQAKGVASGAPSELSNSWLSCRRVE